MLKGGIAMSFTVKIVLAVVAAAMVGGGAMYLVQVENKVIVEAPPPAPVASNPPTATRDIGSQRNLKPLDWNAKQ